MGQGLGALGAPAGTAWLGPCGSNGDFPGRLPSRRQGCPGLLGSAGRRHARRPAGRHGRLLVGMRHARFGGGAVKFACRARAARRAGRGCPVGILAPRFGGCARQTDVYSVAPGAAEKGLLCRRPGSAPMPAVPCGRSLALSLKRSPNLVFPLRGAEMNSGAHMSPSPSKHLTDPPCSALP